MLGWALLVVAAGDTAWQNFVLPSSIPISAHDNVEALFDMSIISQVDKLTNLLNGHIPWFHKFWGSKEALEVVTHPAAASSLKHLHQPFISNKGLLGLTPGAEQLKTSADWWGREAKNRLWLERRAALPLSGEWAILFANSCDLICSYCHFSVTRRVYQALTSLRSL